MTRRQSRALALLVCAALALAYAWALTRPEEPAEFEAVPGEEGR